MRYEPADPALHGVVLTISDAAREGRVEVSEIVAAVSRDELAVVRFADGLTAITPWVLRQWLNSRNTTTTEEESPHDAA